MALTLTLTLTALGGGCGRQSPGDSGSHAARGLETMSNFDWYWRVSRDDDTLRLDNDDNEFTIVIRGDSPLLHLEQGTNHWSMTATQLAPSGREIASFPFIPEIRATLLDGKRGFGEVTRLGHWTVLRTDEIIAFKHDEWGYLLATHGQGNGWLVSIDRDRLGFIYSTEFRRPEP